MTRPGFHARRSATRAPVHVRPADWMDAIGLAQRLARIAGGEPVCSPVQDQELVRLRLMARDLTAESFPVPAPTARLLAGAFLNAARAFAHIDAGPEMRTACAPMLAAAARLTDDLWTAHRTHQAQSTWGRQGSFD